MKHVVFLHLDLGIGGAESLILNLAKATLPNQTNHEESSARHRSNGCDISIYTTHCSQSHCYDEVKPPNGALAPFVRIRGSWIPRKFIFGGTALCSSIRMLYLTHRAAAENPNASVFVIDVLPTGVPYLANYCNFNAGVLFYCHFPDKLLTRDTVNGEVASRIQSGPDRNEIIPLFCKCFSILKAIYRWVMDAIEESTMAYADLVAVNSTFTKLEVSRAFPSLFANDEHVKVLYPAIESTLSKERRKEQRSPGGNSNESLICQSGPIVSLNRFERKKNVALLLHAYGVLLEHASKKGKNYILPPLIVAGGYDPLNVENVEHLAELRRLADEILDRHNLPPSVVLSPMSDDGRDNVFENASITFMPSVSNEGRSSLLQCASVWCYTPHREHFGIVPLEAMDAGLPVVAINSGGPMETIVDGVTGCLIDYFPLGTASPSDNETVKGFANAIENILSDSVSAMRMGKNGQQRVDSIFGMETFREKWWDLLVEAQNRGILRHRSHSASYPSVLRTWLRSIFWEGLQVFTLILLVTYGLREAKLIDKDVTLVRALSQQYQQLFNLDEL